MKALRKFSLTSTRSPHSLVGITRASSTTSHPIAWLPCLPHHKAYKLLSVWKIFVLEGQECSNCHMIQRSNCGSPGQDMSLSIFQSMWRCNKYIHPSSVSIVPQFVAGRRITKSLSPATGHQRHKSVLRDRAKWSKKCCAPLYRREDWL